MVTTQFKPCKSKATFRNQVYKLVQPLTAGFFQDTDWGNVKAVWNALEGAGAVVYIDKATYQPGDNHPVSKTWEFTLVYGDFRLPGRLVACFCGTVTDPTARYDICFIV